MSKVDLNQIEINY